MRKAVRGSFDNYVRGPSFSQFRPLPSSSRQTWTFYILSTLFIGNSSQNSVRNSAHEKERLYFICNISDDSKNLPLSRRRVAFRIEKQDDQRPPMIMFSLWDPWLDTKEPIIDFIFLTCQVISRAVGPKGVGE